jgi:calcineurin-like phosphoesterase family protein
MAVFFTADTHFGHENAIKHCRRPFADADEMNAVLRQNWNARVKDDDDIYIIGDFFFKGRESALHTAHPEFASVLYKTKRT